MSNQLEPTIEENNLKYKSKFYMDFGQELPRDDAEAMLYVMLESLIGKLPWNDIISVPAQHISRNQIDFYVKKNYIFAIQIEFIILCNFFAFQ